MTIHMTRKVYQWDTVDTADTAPEICIKLKFMVMVAYYNDYTHDPEGVPVGHGGHGGHGALNMH